MLRILHHFGDTEVVVDLKQFLEGEKMGTIAEVFEMSITGNQLREKMPSWNNSKPGRSPICPKTFKTKFEKNQLRTFAVALEMGGVEKVGDAKMWKAGEQVEEIVIA
jgi:hypothetical protein